MPVYPGAIRTLVSAAPRLIPARGPSMPNRPAPARAPARQTQVSAPHEVRSPGPSYDGRVPKLAVMAALLFATLHAASGQILGLSSTGAVSLLGTLEDRAVTESSGVVASRANHDIYWTHNDSGDGPILYAFNRDGKSYGRWTVPGAQNIDWEDISIGPAREPGRWYLYAGDIGDNSRNRAEVVVYRVEEPKIGGVPECGQTCRTGPATAFHLRYPDGPHNSETLLVHPVSGDLYIISKANSGDPETTVYVARAPQLGATPAMLTAIATLSIPDRLFRTFIGGITGGDISPDGRRLALCDYFHAYEAELPAGAAFDEIWKQPFISTLIGLGLQTEGVGYTADGQALILTSEGTPCPIYELKLEKH